MSLVKVKSIRTSIPVSYTHLRARNSDSFVMPVRAPVEIFEDETLHRQRRAGMYGWGEHGFAALDTRRVLLGAF